MKAAPRVHEDAALIEENGRKIQLLGYTTIDAGALIIADREDCVISDSHICSGARIRNSVIHGVMARPGSQILESSILPARPGPGSGYSLILEEGRDHSAVNFAFSRGAVVKRVAGFRPERKIHIPCGYCMIGAEEFGRIRPRKGQAVRVHEAFDGGYLVISAQYSHNDDHEQFYDPAQFSKASYLEGGVPPGQEESSETLIVDLSRFDRGAIVGDEGLQGALREIRVKTEGFSRVIFMLNHGSAVIVEAVIGKTREAVQDGDFDQA